MTGKSALGTSWIFTGDLSKLWGEMLFINMDVGFHSWISRDTAMYFIRWWWRHICFNNFISSRRGGNSQPALTRDCYQVHNSCDNLVLLATATNLGAFTVTWQYEKLLLSVDRHQGLNWILSTCLQVGTGMKTSNEESYVMLSQDSWCM